MQSRMILLVCGLVAACSVAICGQEEEPLLTGYVTRAASGSDFDVDGVPIVCSGVMQGAIESAKGLKVSAVGCPPDAPFIGENLAVTGNLGRGAHSIIATRINIEPLKLGEITGAAVIDAQPVQKAVEGQKTGLMVRADGYWIFITGQARIAWNPPLQSLADVKAGNWIRYKGKQDTARVLLVSSVEIGGSIIPSGEQKLREKGEYDPAAVPAQAKQNYWKDSFRGGCRGDYVLGCDPKRFAPFANAEMQARIENIGMSLVPAYQRELPDSDPAKTDFRFQLIDTRLFRSALALPSGIILVPHQVVDRMQNDSQLAAVLADAVAGALERQKYRAEGKTKAAYAAMFGGAFVPYAGGGITMGGSSAESEILKHEQQQSGRVSLALLHDAGFDIDQAPLAWWLLDPGKPKPTKEIEIPDRSKYLYRILGEIWHNPAGTTPAAH